MKNLERVHSAIRKIRKSNFSNPTSLEVKMDLLASEIIKLDIVTENDFSGYANSLSGVLEYLVDKCALDKQIMETCESIETIMQEVDYEDLNSAAAEDLEREIEELCSILERFFGK